jgi:hypothetical protein
VIPDDARELDRDVQAYQRELRALRRRQRVTRLRGPLTRDGMVLPLLAGCLILALITSTLLIMFAADRAGMPDLSGRAVTGQPARQPAPALTRQPAAGQIGGPLPAAVVVIGGRPEPLAAIAAQPSVLVLIPLVCPCASVLRQLGAEAALAHVALYLVGTGGHVERVAQLAAQAGQDPARVAQDPHNVLGRTYGQLGLTAILVRSGGFVVSVTRDLSPTQKLNLAPSLRQLEPAGH